jgi:integrase
MRMPVLKRGTIEPLQSGRFSVRMTYPDGRRQRLHETFESRELAELARDTVVETLGLDDTEGLTLAGFAEGFLEGRELAGLRSAAHDDASVWRTWIATAAFYRRPMRAVHRREVRAWALGVFGQRAKQTAQNALNLLRSAFAQALDDGLVKENPARDVRLPKKARTRDAWTWVHVDELPTLAAVMTDDERDLVDIAIGSGLRSGELRSILLADVHAASDEAEPRMVVRFGSPGAPTKNGKPRTVPLFGMALAAVRRWLDRLPVFCPPSVNDRGLAFPTARGCVRAEAHVLGRKYLGKHPKTGKHLYQDRFTFLAHQAGLYVGDPSRPLVWHSLRHTCASYAISGVWGRSWTLEETKELLGHASIVTTQRYAHLADTALKKAARESGPVGGQGGGQGRGRIQHAHSFLNRRSQVRFLPRAPGFSPDSQSAETALDAAWTRIATLRAGVLAGDEAAAWDAAQALARGVLGDRAVRLAHEVLADGPHVIARALDLADLLEAELAPLHVEADVAGGAR